MKNLLSQADDSNSAYDQKQCENLSNKKLLEINRKRLKLLEEIKNPKIQIISFQ